LELIFQSYIVKIVIKELDDDVQRSLVRVL